MIINVYDINGNLIGQKVAEPEPEPTPEERLAAMPAVSKAQILSALVLTSILTEAEALGWATGTLPAPVEAAIGSLAPELQTYARLRAMLFAEALPSDPLIGSLAAVTDRGPEDVIQVFALAASLPT